MISAAFTMTFLLRAHQESVFKLTGDLVLSQNWTVMQDLWGFEGDIWYHDRAHRCQTHHVSVAVSQTSFPVCVTSVRTNMFVSYFSLSPNVGFTQKIGTEAFRSNSKFFLSRCFVEITLKQAQFFKKLCNFLHQMTVNSCCVCLWLLLCYLCKLCSFSWHRNWSVSSCSLRDVQCRVVGAEMQVWAGGCGEEEGRTFVISQHRERSAGCCVTTSSPLLPLSAPLQGFKPSPTTASTFFCAQMRRMTSCCCCVVDSLTL